jgi:hypothetical protein
MPIMLVKADTGMLSPPSASEGATSGQSHAILCLITTDPDTGWLVGRVPNMAGAHTQGQNLEENTGTTQPGQRGGSGLPVVPSGIKI